MFVVLLAAAMLAAAPTPDELQARLRAGQAALGTRDYATAKREFAAVVEADPKNSTANLNLGIIALIEDDPTAGLRHFSNVKDDPRALIGRLDCELRLRRVEAANGTAKTLESVIATNPAANAHVGTLLAKAGEYAAAIPFLRRASGAEPAHWLGVAEENWGNLADAVKAYGEAARLEPGNEDYRIDHAATLLNAGDTESSVAAFRSVAQDFPKSARVRLGLGSALYLAGQHEAAAQALLEAVQIEPSTRGFDLLGKAYESAGRFQPEIQNEFVKYLATQPGDAAAYAHYGAILHAIGNPVKAREVLSRALELDQNLAAAHLQLGIVEQQAGNTAAALACYQRAAKLEPENSSVHYRLAGMYQKLGERDKSRTELNEFQRLKAIEKRQGLR
jgi:tetratricopeptide (TPR) repeat protein